MGTVKSALRECWSSAPIGSGSYLLRDELHENRLMTDWGREQLQSYTFLLACAIIIFRDFLLANWGLCFFLFPRNKVFFHDFEDKPPQLRKKVLTLLHKLRR